MSAQSFLPLGVVGTADGDAKAPDPEKTPHDITYGDAFNYFAHKRRGAPLGWQWRSVDMLGDDVRERDRAKQFSLMKGYVHNGARFKTGKHAGQLRPRSPVPGTEREFVFAMAEFDESRREWELETGLCSKCDGKGEELASWSQAEGTRTTKCTRCFGTGKAQP